MSSQEQYNLLRKLHRLSLELGYKIEELPASLRQTDLAIQHRKTSQMLQSWWLEMRRDILCLTEPPIDN